jgi:hypothetical protein
MRMEPNQKEDIARLDKKSSYSLIQDIQKLIVMLEGERSIWISFFRENIDKVLKGAVFFIGKALWDPSDRIDSL